MGSLFVVRHGQAAFGTENYDCLTALGVTQARLLADYFAVRKLRFEAVFTGTLQRQIETARVMFAARPDLGDVTHERFVGLNEYDPDAVLMAHTGILPVPGEAAVRRDPTVVREHFRRLRDALIAWAEDRIKPEGTQPFEAFQEGAVAVLVEARERFPDGNVLIVSSGGPIAATVAAALSAPPAVAIELNLRIRNSSSTEYATRPRRHHLLSFNGVPHLEVHADPDLITYA
jgi:broad specificity phosphatase PhoE